MQEAGTFYTRAMNLLEAGGTTRNEVGRVLDFGCGWGRIYRLFLRNSIPQDLVGVDIDQACIEECSRAIPYGTFEICEPLPPLRFDEASFDVITAYSVFSHLAEPAFLAWLREFERVLRPGGAIFFTTLKTAHLDVWHARRGEAGHGPPLSSVGFDVKTWRKRAAAGDHLFVPTGGGGLREPSFYGEAIVPRGCVEREALRLGLDVLAFETTSALPQAFVALRKPTAE